MKILSSLLMAVLILATTSSASALTVDIHKKAGLLNHEGNVLYSFVA